jgi:hypothetical protein
MARSKRSHPSPRNSIPLGRRMTKSPRTAEELKQYRETIATQYKDYMLALGRFVTEFSNVEALIQKALWQFAGVPEPTAQAVFSGTRTDGCIQFINRIAAAQNWSEPRKKELEHIFSQLGMINKLRNDILHYGSMMTEPLDGLWLISNKPFVHLPERIQEICVTPNLLEDATSDLRTIQWFLYVIMGTDGASIFDPETRRTWLYKSPPRDLEYRKNLEARLRQLHQPPSSDE